MGQQLHASRYEKTLCALMFEGANKCAHIHTEVVHTVIVHTSAVVQPWKARAHMQCAHVHVLHISCTHAWHADMHMLGTQNAVQAHVQ